MFGRAGAGARRSEEGVAFRALRTIGASLRSTPPAHGEGVRSVSLSFVEIYNEEVFDLLAGPELRGTPLRAHGTLVRRDALPQRTCDVSRFEEQVAAFLQEGFNARTVGETVCNARSSRSHAIATVHIKWQNTETSVHLIDLAGSERAGQFAMSDGQLKEGCNINLSLTTLGRAVSAATAGNNAHVPYRDSALTWLLQDALLGIGARSFLIATVNLAHQAETLSTLRYARQYSILKTDLIHRINKLAAQITTWTQQLKRELAVLLEACSHRAGPSPGRRWDERYLRSERVVRVSNRARAQVQGHPQLECSAKHLEKIRKSDAGIVRSEHAAEEQGVAALVEVVFPEQQRGAKDVVLRFPTTTLDDVDKPQELGDLIARIDAIHREIAAVKGEIRAQEELLQMQLNGPDE